MRRGFALTCLLEVFYGGMPVCLCACKSHTTCRSVLKSASLFSRRTLSIYYPEVIAAPHRKFAPPCDRMGSEMSAQPLASPSEGIGSHTDCSLFTVLRKGS